MAKLKHWLPYIFIIVIVSLFVLYPSFNLALTGDDYLGLWRYNETLAGRQPGPQTPLSYFFIDYGPQDLTTVIIHSFVGFKAHYFYYISFLFRLLASLSFIPLIFYLTKNKQAAFLAALFFSVCTTGLETTDWSFNMPSYLAIAILNIFLVTYFHARKTKKISYLLLSCVLFLITIVVQPIRMAFLPLVILGIEGFSLLQHKFNKNEVIHSFMRTLMFIAAFIVLLKSTSIGMQAGGVGQNNSLFTQYTKGVSELVANNDLPKLLTPIGQLGSIIIPDNFLPTKIDTYSNQKFFVLSVIPLLVVSLLLLKMLKKTLSLEHNRLYITTQILTVIWTAASFVIYKIQPQYPIQNSQFVSYMIGGCFVISLLFIIGSLWKKDSSLYMATALFLIFFAYSIPWLRTPGSINPTVGRYLIVSAAGLSILVGVLIAHAKNRNLFLVVFFIPLFLIHLLSSQSYISNLSSVRANDSTEKIRNTLSLNTETDRKKVPTVYYFQTDNHEVLYHSILFGFPMVMKYYHNAENPWNIAYTTSWREVYDAHVDGTGLTRFGTISPIAPVPLENIYGYKIESGELRDITEEVRTKLEIETKIPITQ